MKARSLISLAFRGLLVLNVGLTLANVGLWFMAARQGLLWRADFTALYTGGALIRDGRSDQLYDFELQTAYQQRILDDRSFEDGLLPFDYPPHTALLFAPLSLFPRSIALGIWLMVQLALLVWLMYSLWHLSTGWSRVERILLLTGVLAFPPLLSTFLLGSFSLLLLLCLLRFYMALKTGREACSGAWLVLGSFKPQSVVLSGFVLLGARRWRALATSIVLGMVVAGVVTLWLGPGVWVQFVKVVFEVGQLHDAYGVVPAKMHNFKGLLVSLFGKVDLSLIDVLSFGAFLGQVAFTLWLWSGKWRPEAVGFELRLAVTIGAGLLFSLHLYPQDSLMWIAPLLMVYEYLRQAGLSRSGYALFVLSWPILFFADQFFLMEVIGLRLPVLLMLFLWVWLMWRLSHTSAGYRSARG